MISFLYDLISPIWVSTLSRLSDVIAWGSVIFVLGRLYRSKVRSPFLYALPFFIIGAFLQLALDIISKNDFLLYEINYILWIYLIFAVIFYGKNKVKFLHAIVLGAAWPQTVNLAYSIAGVFPGFSLVFPLRILAVFIYLLYLYLVTRNAPSTDAPLSMDYLIGCSSVCLINIAVFYLSPLNASSDGNISFSMMRMLVSGGFLLSEAVMLHMVHLLISQNENQLSQVIWHNQREESAVIVNYNAALEDEYQKLQHEIRHTASLASLLVQRGEYVEAQEVLAELQQDVDNKREAHTSLSVVDTILDEYRQKASVMNVLFTADIHLTDELPVSPIDLCSMLSNMLSNALEASVNSPDPFVSIEIYPVKSYLMIRVKNRVSTDVLKDNPNLTTTKHNPAAHGKGTRVMRQICQKYNGMLTFEVDNLVFDAEAFLLI